MKTLLADPSAAFYTTGNGLKGVPVVVMDRDTGELIYARVYSNTAKRLRLDVVLSRNPDRYDSYLLGSIPMSIESGDWTFGSPQEYKTFKYCTVSFESGAAGSLALYIAADPSTYTTTTWNFAGYIPLKGRDTYRLPLSGTWTRARCLRWALFGTEPGQVTCVTHVTFEFETEKHFG